MRRLALALAFVVVAATLAAPRTSAEQANELARVRGDVTYAVPAASATTRPLIKRKSPVSTGIETLVSRRMIR